MSCCQSFAHLYTQRFDLRFIVSTPLVPFRTPATTHSFTHSFTHSLTNTRKCCYEYAFIGIIFIILFPIIGNWPYRPHSYSQFKHTHKQKIQIQSRVYLCPLPLIHHNYSDTFRARNIFVCARLCFRSFCSDKEHFGRSSACRSHLTLHFAHILARVTPILRWAKKKKKNVGYASPV